MIGLLVSWGPFLESPEKFSGMYSHFSFICVLKQRGVYTWNFLYEVNLSSY